MPSTAVSVKLTDEERARLARVAKATKRSAHYLMREALQKHMAELEWKLDFIREAEESYKHYKETGLHLTHEELKEWAKDPRQDMPKCHR